MPGYGREHLDDVLGRADRLILPEARAAVPGECRLEDAARLLPGVADDHDADAGRPLDLGGIPPSRSQCSRRIASLRFTASRPPPTLFASA